VRGVFVVACVGCVVVGFGEAVLVAGGGDGTASLFPAGLACAVLAASRGNARAKGAING